MTGACAAAVLEAIAAFVSGTSVYLPVVDNVSYLFDLMQSCLSISDLLEFIVQVSDRTCPANLLTIPQVGAQGYSPELLSFDREINVLQSCLFSKHFVPRTSFRDVLFFLSGGYRCCLAPLVSVFLLISFPSPLTITVPSPGLPGQCLMMLEYRVPVYRNQRCSGLTAH